MFTRRRLLGAGASAVATSPLLRADVPDHLWQGYDFGPGPKVTDRLNQGPFPVEQDQGWRTISTTTPTTKPVRNFGLGLRLHRGESGSLAARAGRQTLENHAHGKRVAFRVTCPTLPSSRRGCLFLRHFQPALE